jgi:hypothetical protein
MFGVSRPCKIFPSARCTLDENLVSRDSDVFRENKTPLFPIRLLRIIIVLRLYNLRLNRCKTVAVCLCGHQKSVSVLGGKQLVLVQFFLKG